MFGLHSLVAAGMIKWYMKVNNVSFVYGSKCDLKLFVRQIPFRLVSNICYRIATFYLILSVQLLVPYKTHLRQFVYAVGNER